MKSKKKVDINTLVDLVVNTMSSDTTLPIPGDQRKGWESDQLLIGHIDKLMTYRLNDPAGYAEIGRRVAAQVSDLPKMVALAKIAELRGKRLIMPVSAKRRQSLLKLIGIIAELVMNLPEDSCRERLRSLLKYNEGVLYDALEMFVQAAGMQRQSAEIAKANGDKSGAAIGLFLEQVYLLKRAMVDGDQAAMEAAFSAMGQRSSPLVEAVHDTPLEVSWGQGNVSCHIFQACYPWLGKDHPDLDKSVASIATTADSLKGVWGDIAKHYIAINSFRKGETWAKAWLEKVAAESTDVTRKAEALLVLARRSIANGDKKLARELVKKMPKKGASHIRAIAERLLA